MTKTSSNGFDIDELKSLAKNARSYHSRRICGQAKAEIEHLHHMRDEEVQHSIDRNTSYEASIKELEDEIERLRSVLRDLLTEVEYAVSIINIPCSWTDENQDTAIVNARSALEPLPKEKSK
jgi:hypothetical protein